MRAYTAIAVGDSVEPSNDEYISISRGKSQSIFVLLKRSY